MTTVRRLVSGNVAGMAAVVSNLVVQIATVPIYLGAWGASLLATWLALVTAAALAIVFDTAHLDYLGFEAMKLPIEDRVGRSRILSDALPVFALVGVAELLILALFLWSPLAARVFAVPAASHELTIVRCALLAMYAIALLIQVPVGLLGRGLSSVGHYPATVWWFVVLSIAQVAVPAVVALLGGKLVGAVLAYVIATSAVLAANGWHYWRLARRERFGWMRPDLAAGTRRLFGGLTLGAANVIEYFQQTGFRLVLLPFLGAARLVSFTTLRTVANVVQQGLQVLVNPMVPELMRFVSARDRHRTALMMNVMLYMAVIVLCPGLVLLQAIVRPV